MLEERRRGDGKRGEKVGGGGSVGGEKEVKQQNEREGGLSKLRRRTQNGRK